MWCCSELPEGLPILISGYFCVSCQCQNKQYLEISPLYAVLTSQVQIFNWICKSKGLPQQAEVAQGVPGSLRPRIFLTFQHYKGGRSSAKRTGRLYPRRYPRYSLSEAESTSGHMVLSGESRKKSPVTPPGIDPGTVRLVAQCLNHYATPGPNWICSKRNFLME